MLIDTIQQFTSLFREGGCVNFMIRVWFWILSPVLHLLGYSLWRWEEACFGALYNLVGIKGWGYHMIQRILGTGL
jgi:hypothetical protein